MDIRQLRYFVALAEERNFTRAAARLHMAQPPLSRQIQQLEEELGAQLIVHNTRPATLTEAGRFFYSHARNVLLQVEELRTMTRRLGLTDRSLVIGFVASTLYGALPEVLRRFRAARPDVEVLLVELSSIEQVEELKGGRIDVGFGRIRFDDPAIRREVLREEMLVAALPTDHSLLVGQEPLTLAELAEEPLIVYPRTPRPSYADQVLSCFRDRGLSPAPIREVRELQVALGLVAAGLGICLVPSSVQRLKRDDVAYRLLAERSITSPIIMNTMAGTERPDCELLLRLIDAIYSEAGITRGLEPTGLLTPERGGAHRSE